MDCVNPHEQWRLIAEAMRSISDAQLGLLVRQTFETGVAERWLGFDYDDRAGLRKFLVKVLV